MDDSDILEGINAEIVKAAQDILVLDPSEFGDYDLAMSDMVERLTAVWYNGYEHGLEDRLSDDLEGLDDDYLDD